MTRAIGCAAALAALVSVAHAAPRAAPVTSAAVAPASGPPDAAVQEAADANLESIEARRGLTFDAALGGGLMFGFGIKDSVGRGGSLSLRLGHVATRRTVITFELHVTLALHKPAEASPTAANSNVNLLAGARHYVNPSLWVRGAAGLGVYQARDVAVMGGMLGDVTLIGPALLGGVGLDVARFKWTVLTLELATSAMANRDGVLVASGINAGLSFD